LSATEQADYTPAIWALLDVDGGRYALPADNAQYGLYYNKALFDAYDAAHPDDTLGYPSAAWTWDDLRDAATRLRVVDAQGNETQYGIDFDLWAWPFLTFYAQAGGELWDETGTRTLIDSDAGLRALELIVELLPQSASMRAVSKIGSTSGPDKLFARGQSAMMLEGSWRAPDLERVNSDLDFAIAPLPHDAKRSVVSGSVLWAVSAHSANKERAWQMIKWMTDQEQSLAYWDLLRVAPPARLSVLHSPEFRATPGLVDADGREWVRPMAREQFDDRAAWLIAGVTPGVDGVAPVFVPVGPYQRDLEEAIDAMLKRAMEPGRRASLEELLSSAANSVAQIIDRDRRARGMTVEPQR
jgi:ABC-type glycerol-3-phosphate transport system substrate-binding protein